MYLPEVCFTPVCIDGLRFYIHYISSRRKFVNFGGIAVNASFSGKATALDIGDRHAPFPFLSIVRETRVRGRWPGVPLPPKYLVIHLGKTGSSRTRNEPLPSPTGVNNGSQGTWTNFHFPAQSVNANPGGQVLNEVVINEILAATYASEPWTAYERRLQRPDGGATNTPAHAMAAARFPVAEAQTVALFIEAVAYCVYLVTPGRALLGADAGSAATGRVTSVVAS
ncbi:hypothetical protein PHLGIDRAFT_119607 [Phlebiopsis gigantea 11061_1 CR5-6]|uniref:Uncharacterized protein n=1 Tax=Phlebiopsis gigantea (strain 11061_1 CR5-6) TaxID=745531 RepID=A0A0C3S5N2_PHLG1|nr:hypothetical protein PHLGIDRAFT_119607 [Phlebiopsis gigantea 11061_1 CR5-6]